MTAIAQAPAAPEMSILERLSEICKKHRVTATYESMLLVEYFDFHELFPETPFSTFAERWAMRKKTRNKQRPEKALASLIDQHGWSLEVRVAMLRAYLEYIETFKAGTNELMVDQLGQLAYQMVPMGTFLTFATGGTLAPEDPEENGEQPAAAPAAAAPEAPAPEPPAASPKKKKKKKAAAKDAPVTPMASQQELPFDVPPASPAVAAPQSTIEAELKACLNYRILVKNGEALIGGIMEAVRGTQFDMVTDDGERLYNLDRNQFEYVRLNTDQSLSPLSLAFSQAVDRAGLEVKPDRFDKWESYLYNGLPEDSGHEKGAQVESITTTFQNGDVVRFSLMVGDDNGVFVSAGVELNDGRVVSEQTRELLAGVWIFGGAIDMPLRSVNIWRGAK